MSEEPQQPATGGPSDTSRTPLRPTAEPAGFADDAMQATHTQLMREKEEPREGFAPTPIFLIFLFAGLMFWGGIYFANHSGDFNPAITDPRWKPGQGEAGAATAVAFDPVKHGERIFKNNCAQCHQLTGQGLPGTYPPLVDSEWVKGSEERFIKILLAGLSGPITVKGGEYNGSMPSFSALKDRDIAGVASYVRATWNGGEPVGEEKVAALRKASNRSTPWTAPELLKEHPLQ